MIKKSAWIIFALVLLLVSFTNSKADTNHVVISQIQIEGATATDEFVELFNPTTNAVDLTGFRLTKKVSSGTQSTLIASMSGTIDPNGYYLIKHPTGYTGSVVAETSYSTGSSITASNTVFLYSDPGVTIVDKVGFGSSFESETLPFSTNPVEGQSILRINNQDSDNNSLDFELLTTSSPRNSDYIQATPISTSSPTITPSPTPLGEPSPTVQVSPTPSEAPTQTPIATEVPTFSPTPKSDHVENKHWVKKFFESCQKYFHEHHEKRWPSFNRFFKHNKHR